MSRAPAVVSSAATTNPYRIEPALPIAAKPAAPAPVLPRSVPATPQPGIAALPVSPLRPSASVAPVPSTSAAASGATSTVASAATAWPGGGEALNLTRGPGGHKRLLLSFDGGSSAEVATEVLDLLKARGVHTTLFLTGAFIQRFPILVKRMAAEGHELGNHTMNHPHFAPGMKRDPKWTRERIQRELLDADAALVRLLGRPMDPFWRAPYGEHTAEIRRWAEELGYRHVGWSEGADTLDWATPKERRLYRSGEAIVSRLQQRLSRDGDGLIVLMHLGSGREEGDRPTDGLGAFMDRAKKEGWTFVSAGGFLRDLGKPAWDPKARIALLNGTALRAR
jgi:peptidoglycan/xylan/chitin deacetylase (PgdA/CDA1 family)